MRELLADILNALTSVIVALTRFIEATAPWSTYVVLLAPPFLCLLCRRGLMMLLTLVLSVGGWISIGFGQYLGFAAVLLSWIITGRVIHRRLRRPVAAAAI